MSETIDRLEQWVEHWEDHQPEEFIADLRALIATAKAAQRAAEVLQKVARYNCGTKAFRPEIMVQYPDGTWMRFKDAERAIQILKGECSE